MIIDNTKSKHRFPLFFSFLIVALLFFFSMSYQVEASDAFKIDTEDTTYFQTVLPTDTTKSLVLNVNDTSVTLEMAEPVTKSGYWSWSSDNTDVVTVTDGYVSVVGAGKTQVHVSFLGNDTINVLTDMITVYVIPSVTTEIGSELRTISVHSDKQAEAFHTNFVMRNALSSPVLNLMDWAIIKYENGQDVMIENNCGVSSDLIQLKGAPGSVGKLIAVGKAGNYQLRLYPRGVLRAFLNAGVSIDSIDAKLYQEHQLNIYGEFGDKTMYLNVGDSFDLATAFNLTRDSFHSIFETSLESGTNTITYANSSLSGKASEVGDALIKVQITDSSAASILCDSSLPDCNYYQILVHVSDGIRLDCNDLTLNKASTYQLKLANRMDGVVSYISSDSSCVTVSQEGKISAVNATPDGEDAVITATLTTKSGISYRDTCIVRVLNTVTELSIYTQKTAIDVGETLSLSSDYPYVSSIAPLKWISSNQSVISVTSSADNKSAILTAHAPGTAEITCFNSDSFVFDSISITVHNPATSLSLSETSATITLPNQYYMLNPSYETVGDDDITLLYHSSDETVASVNTNGLVTGKKPGTVIITVKPAYNPNNLFATCILTIEAEKIVPPVEVIKEIPKEVIKEVVIEVPTQVSKETVRDVITEALKDIPSTTQPESSGTNKTDVNYKSLSTVKKTKVKNVKKRSLTISYKKVTGATSYEIQYSTDKRFKKNICIYTTKSLKAIITKLKKKTYYIRIRATSDKSCSNWSKVIKIKVKK